MFQLTSSFPFWDISPSYFIFIIAIQYTDNSYDDKTNKFINFVEYPRCKGINIVQMY